MADSVSKRFGKVIQIDEEQIQQHLGDLVRGTVEETLNKLLDAEADQLCNAARYERTEPRKDSRAGHYKRWLHTKAGEVKLADRVHSRVLSDRQVAALHRPLLQERFHNGSQGQD